MINSLSELIQSRENKYKRIKSWSFGRKIIQSEFFELYFQFRVEKNKMSRFQN